MSFSEIIEVLVRFFSDYGHAINLLGASAAIAYMFFKINEEFFLSILRLLGRSLRWVFDRFTLVMAWVGACSAVLLSFLLCLQAFYGNPVSLFDCYVLFIGGFISWGLERLYRSELNASKQRGDQ